MVPGVIASSEGGARWIRWDDGYSTIPLGNVQEYDEYIAAHTDLQSTRVVRKAEQHNEGAEASVRSYIARVKRA
jgi:hypothetical protein